MTTSSGHEAAPSNDPPPETTFKWDCPYCGESRTHRYAGPEEEVEGEVVAALRSHIVGSDGGGHGPRDERPADDERTLFEYVRCVQPCEEE